MTPQEFLLFSEGEIALELASRAKRLRINLNLTQKEFGAKTAIAFATYRKFEQTGETSLVNFLKILRHLGELKEIYNLMHEDDIKKYGLERYVEMSKQNSRTRVKKHK